MKNKTLTYVLLGVVALIWYQVFFRVKDNLFGEAVVETPMTENRVAEIPIISKDTFELRANYSDPFGANNLMSSRPKINTHVQRQVKQVQVQQPKRNWPKIHYYGLVRKTKSDKPLAILSIDGRQYTFYPGESPFDGITVKRIWRDSVEVWLDKETRFFKQ